MQQTRETPFPCTVQQLDNGIYHIILHEASQQAVDTWLGYMSELAEALNNVGYAPVLLDLREPGMVPVVYATHAVRDWTASNPQPPAVDIAVVYRYGLFYSLANALTGLSRIGDGVRLFHNGRFEDAQAWLVDRAAAYR